MSDTTNQDVIWEKMAERLGHLFSQLRAIIPDSPNPSLQDTKAEDIHEALKKYQGDEKEVHHFAKMDPKTFYAIFCEWQRLGK